MYVCVCVCVCVLQIFISYFLVLILLFLYILGLANQIPEKNPTRQTLRSQAGQINGHILYILWHIRIP
jgi:hypothetical protein